MLNKSKIYSIQNEVNGEGLVEIETIILNGLYRFSILGINQKNSTDTKDRIYSALRSQKLINLKSDNKKITVNLLPTNIDKKTNVYDLGIALSCMSCMNQISLENDIIVTGELSILGNIIPSKLLLRSINQAVKNNIKTIICSQKDIETLTKYQKGLDIIIKNNNIKFISSNNLGDLIKNIKNNIYTELNNNHTDDVIIFDKFKYKSLNISDLNIYKIILALCTKRNVFIENNNNCYIKKYIKNLNYYNIKIRNYELLNISNILNLSDEQILEKYTYPRVSILDSQVKKNELQLLLSESLFGFNIVEDFLSINEESLYIIKKFYKSSIFCFYNSCPCGNNNVFFNNINTDKCYCLQRNILKHRQKIHKIENGFFDFYINNTSNINTDYSVDDYLAVNSIINDFRNISLNLKDTEILDNFLKNNENIFEIDYLNEIIKLAQDINKLENIIMGNMESDKNINYIKPNQENINLAMNLLKKDF